MAGHTPEKDLQWDGLSQWAGLMGAPIDPAERMICIAKTNERCLRLGDWKLVQPAKGRAELYNIAADPYEKENLATNETTKLAELKTRLEAEHAKDNPTLPADLAGLPH